jgi:hypothetical protein
VSLVTQGVQALPEIRMSVSCELPVGGQAFQSMRFQPGVIAFEVLEEVRLKDHEAAIDPALTYLGFLREICYQVTVKDQAAEA